MIPVEKCHPIRMMRIVVVLDLLWEVEKLLVPALRLWLLLVILEIQPVGQPTLLGGQDLKEDVMKQVARLYHVKAVRMKTQVCVIWA
ncbi:hypothetical protein GCM10023116_37380 [Kistimonas scapharcae]|uniref:Uncharacterized protein n=1 Tax=Kistimonas scapharcae TaxID=1036133 RepID=A0ABP8V7B9_9GAMM